MDNRIINAKNNLDPMNQNYFNNTLLSDINMTRTFPGKPYQVSAKIALSQNSSTKNIALTSPILNFSTSQFFPLKKVSKSEIIKRLGVIYNVEGQNKSTFQDTLLRDGNYSEIGNQFMNGMRQNISIQTTGGVFKNIVKITPNLRYSTNLNFQQIHKSYDAINNNTITDTLRQSGFAHNFSMNVTATTNVYTYYQFVGKNKPIMRHILTPTISFNYMPLITANITDSVGVNKTIQTYSRFQNSAYNYSASGNQGLINFGVNNSFELKRKSDKDTVTGFQKIRIIDGFSITGNYDILKDSMKLSDIALSIRISPFKWVNFVANSGYSFYGWDTITNASIASFALGSNGRVGRSVRNSFSTTLTITSEESRKKIEQNKENIAQNWQADFDYFYLHPERIIDFEIPWKVNLTHQLNINRNMNKTSLNNDEFLKTHTLTLDGDVSMTKRWKLGAVVNFDMKDTKITNANFTLNRDMHCWALSFRWTPVGMNKSFLLTIRNTSSLFKDAKLDFRKPPAFL